MATRGTLEKNIDRLCGAIGMTVGVASFAIAILVAYSVLAREVLHSSDAGIPDLSTYLMGYITFVGAGYALWEGGHVGVNLLTAHLRGRAHTIVAVIANVLIALVGAVFAWLCFGFWWDAWSTGERGWGTFSIPLWLPYLSLFVGAVLFLVLQLARIALGRIFRTPTAHGPE